MKYYIKSFFVTSAVVLALVLIMNILMYFPKLGAFLTLLSAFAVSVHFGAKYYKDKDKY